MSIHTIKSISAVLDSADRVMLARKVYSVFALNFLAPSAFLASRSSQALRAASRRVPRTAKPASAASYSLLTTTRPSALPHRLRTIEVLSPNSSFFTSHLFLTVCSPFADLKRSILRAPRKWSTNAATGHSPSYRTTSKMIRLPSLAMARRATDRASTRAIMA